MMEDNRQSATVEYWYVLFIKTGFEKHMIDKLNKYFLNDESRAFLPYVEFYHKYANKIVRKERKLMFPGYVFMKSKRKDLDFFDAIKRFARETSSSFSLLSYGESERFAMSKEDKGFFSDFFDEEFAVEMSRGIICGDRVIITDGPLLGRESIIRKINRHKKEAVIEIDIMGRATFVKVGLNIVQKF